MVNDDWFNQLQFPYPDQQVLDHYKTVMLQGVIDIETRQEDKIKYKSYLEKWRTMKAKVKIYKNKIETYMLKLKNLGKVENTMSSLDYSLTDTGKSANKRVIVSQFQVFTKLLDTYNPFIILDFNKASDIINLVRTNSVQEKLDLLVSSGSLTFKAGARTRFRGSVLLSLVMNKFQTNSSHVSVSSDSNWLIKVNPSRFLLGDKNSYTDQCLLYYTLVNSMLVRVTKSLGTMMNW